MSPDGTNLFTCQNERGRLPAAFVICDERAVDERVTDSIHGGDNGQDLIEYGLLIGIITLACVLAMTSIGGKIAAYFNSLNSAMP